MDKKKRLLTDEALGTLVDRKVQNAVGVITSKLSKEREKVSKYYNLELPRQQHSGSSSYVASDVYDSVEAMKADLLETFSGGHDIVKFSPQGPEDIEACRVATEFCSYVVHRQNPGYSIFHDVIDDGLKHRVGVVKVYWDADKEVEDETFDLDEGTVQALSAQEDVEELEAELTPEGTYKGTLTRVKANNSQVRIDNIQPECFGVEPQAKRLKGYFHYHRELMTKEEMKAAGLDVSKLANIPSGTDEMISTELETDARFGQIDSGYRTTDDDNQKEMKRYVVYECYDTLILEKGDRARLYKITICAKQVLDVQEVSRSPFKVFVPLRTAHNFWGNSFAARVIPTQNARTVLTRGILDHTSVTNNPRYTVLQGGLTNPREMLDNRLGGIVNISRPDAVMPLQQAPLNPFVFQTLSTLKENNEQTTGISSLSQGMNKDAISKQNSQGMVSELVDLSKQRQKMVARNFSEFLAELYIEVYNLVLENEDRYCVVQVAGQWVEVDPSSWQKRKDYTVEFYLGQGARDAEAGKLTQLASMAMQDEFLARSMGEEGRYNLAHDVANMLGIKSFNRYFKPPAETPPAQPNPETELAKKELEFKTQELAADAQMAQAKAAAEQAKSQTEIMLAQLEQMNAKFDQMIKLADSQRKDMDVANKIDVSQRELAILEAAPPPQDGATVIASPNS